MNKNSKTKVLKVEKKFSKLYSCHSVTPLSVRVRISYSIYLFEYSFEKHPVYHHA